MCGLSEAEESGNNTVISPEHEAMGSKGSESPCEEQSYKHSAKPRRAGNFEEPAIQIVDCKMRASVAVLFV